MMDPSWTIYTKYFPSCDATAPYYYIHHYTVPSCIKQGQGQESSKQRLRRKKNHFAKVESGFDHKQDKQTRSLLFPFEFDIDIGKDVSEKFI